MTGADQSDERSHPEEPRGRRLAALSLAALGVVFGDISTSPLYAVRECFHGEYGIAPADSNVLGVISLMIWSLGIVVSVKYLVFVLRADNDGEGGVIALTALLRRGSRSSGGRSWLVLLGVFAACLLYGDGMDASVPYALDLARDKGLDINVDEASFFLGRERVLPDRRPLMAPWRERLFSWLSRNSLGATAFFHLPPSRVIEIGAQVEL